MIERRIQGVGDTPGVNDGPPLTLEDLVSTPRSGLLVAEGGMGKSTFLEAMSGRLTGKATFVRLAHFSGNPQGLVNKIEGAAKVHPGHTLILDGLDEAVDLAGTLCQCIPDLPDGIHVWIASRECRQLVAVSKTLKKTTRYRLLPFTKDDIKTRAQEKTLEITAVEDFLREHDLWSICGNPQGCDFVLQAFKQSNGQGAWTSQEIWRQGILSLCAETDSNTKPLDKNAGQFSVDQIYACAAWIALNLNLSGKNAVFTGERETECPSQALPVSSLVGEGTFSRALIETTLPRGVFLPWGGGRSGFAHATYSDYLAAEGFRRHVPRGQWDSLLLDHELRCLFPQRIPVTQWLMTGHPDLADEVFEIEPESFLTAALVSSRKPLCQVLLARAEKMDAYWRSAQYDVPFHFLKSEATRKTLLDFFSGVGCDINESSFALAANIAKACGYFDLLADFALEDRSPRKLRVIAAYGVCGAPSEVRRRLRPLLDRLTELDDDDEFDRGRGALLRACWPDLLSAIEVLQYLVPGRCSGIDSYSMFLSHEFVGPFLERLDSAVIPASLAWAVRQFQWLDSQYSAGELAEIGQIIYTVCWRRAAEMDAVAYISLLADGFLAASAKHETPFHTSPTFNGRKLPDSAWVSQEQVYAGHAELRFAVLQEVVKRGDFLKGNGYWLLHGVFPLVRTSKDDLCRLVKVLTDDPYQAQAALWTSVILSFASAFLDYDLDDDLDRLHTVRPDLFPLTAYERRKEREEYRREHEEMQRETREALEKHKADRLENQRNADRWIKEWLADGQSAISRFPTISCYISLEDGDLKEWSCLDMRQSPGWKKLTSDQQVRLVAAAEGFLKDAPPPEFSPRSSSLEWHKALVLVKLCNRAAYDALPETVWRKCAVEVLNFSASDTDEHYPGILNDLSERFPEIAQDALVRLLELDEKSSVLTHWGARLSRTQAEAVWSSRFTLSRASDGRVYDRVLSELARFQSEVVCSKVAEWLKEGFAVRLDDPFHDVLRLYALQLDSKKYVSAFLGTIREHSDWGRQWFEKVVDSIVWHTEESPSRSVRSWSADEIGMFYEWLDTQYPFRDRPDFKGGTVTVLTQIYDFKERLFSILVTSGKPGSARVVERMVAKVPGLYPGHAETARRNEVTARLPTLRVVEVRELVELKKAVIASAGDLQRKVLSLLSDYQDWLKGKTPAVEDLWDSAVPSPKKEEAISDHLGRFFRDRLPRATFANREVQISRKLAEGGEAGTRTDIWIDCETVCQDKVSLCIEVKCSWNPDAKTAIADQLVGRYMSPGRADAGILLFEWFHCPAWKTEKKSVWVSPEEAKADLEKQVQAVTTAKPLDAVVLDCRI